MIQSNKIRYFVSSGAFHALLAALNAAMAIHHYRQGDWFWFVISLAVAIWAFMFSYQLAVATNFWRTLAKIEKEQSKPSDPPNAKV